MSNRQVVDNKPSLRALSFVLRNPELWPKEFRFDFRWTPCCAMGLCERLWNQLGLLPNICDLFDISHSQAVSFFQRGAYRPVADAEVTPKMIADRIDAYLAAQ